MIYLIQNGPFISFKDKPDNISENDFIHWVVILLSQVVAQELIHLLVQLVLYNRQITL